MIRGAARLAVAALLAGAAGAGAQDRFELTPRLGTRTGSLSSADPSAIVAAEIAFGQLARKEGQWTGFRKTSDKDAVMFVPGIVNAQAWLRKLKDPARSVTWSPERIVIACDGSYAVSQGHAEWPDGRKGGFVTIWRRLDNGSYKWVLDWGTDLPRGLNGEDGIDGKVADCPARRGPDAGPAITGETPDNAAMRQWRENGGRTKRPRIPRYDVVRIPDPPPASGAGQSHDGTLRWQWTTTPQGARTLKVMALYGGRTETLIDDSVAAGS